MRTQKTLYDKDFQAWLHQQVFYLQKKDFAKIDLPHLLEEMETLGNSNPQALESHLIIILLHMLKQKHQPDYASKSWRDSIVNGRVQIDKIIENSPSLKNHLKDEKVFNKCFQSARRYAAKETGIDIRKFEKKCSWNIKEILE